MSKDTSKQIDTPRPTHSVERTAERRGPLEALFDEEVAPRLDGRVEAREHLDGRLPVHARVRDGHAMLERGGALGRHVLATCVDVRLDHHARDVAVAARELPADVRDDLGLVIVILLRVAVCVCVSALRL